ncbi:hypothetical protein BH09BAC1_BH09BAC1_03740 [soil metagenome]
METFELQNDIKVLFVKAESFPDGILVAYQELEQKLGDVTSRTFYGLSRMEDGCGIAYYACAQQKDASAALDLPTIIIDKGTYLTQTISNWRGSEHLIRETFARLIKDPRLMPDSFCVEWYKENGEVMCMVRIAK